jgi:hypothetical protein
MIPSGYKEDVVYSPIPTNGNGDLSFTRASNGTRVNSAGLVEVVSWNMAGYSEDFSNAYWTKNNIPVMAYNVATAPNGTMTADSIKSDSSSVYQSVSATTITVAPNSTVTLSIYIKKETSKTYFTGSYLYFTGGTTKLTYVLFDEVNGSINIIAPDEVSMVTSVESVGNWWRFIVTGTDTGNNTNLDFAFYGTLSQNGTSLNPGIGSVRTIWGAQVNIGSTAKPYFPTTDRLNVPRLTYQNGGGGCPSLLLEKQSTNLALYSEQFSNAVWTQFQGGTITANSIISPDGTQNADTLTVASGQAFSGVYQTISGSSDVYTISIFAKYNTKRWLFLFDASASGQGWFDLQNGVLGTIPSGYTGSIENFGNGWFRCIFKKNTAVTPAFFQIGLVDADGFSAPTSNGSSYIYGAQLEASSYPTSYIPTTSASATRVADGPVNLSTTQTLTNFTLFLDGLIFENGQNMFFGSGNSAWYIDIDGSIGRIVLDLASGRIYNAFSSLTSNQRFKLAVKRSAGVVDAFVNGTKLTPNTQVTDTTSLTLSSITWGFSSTYYPKMKVNEICAFQSALSDSDCQALTTL